MFMFVERLIESKSLFELGKLIPRKSQGNERYQFEDFGIAWDARGNGCFSHTTLGKGGMGRVECAPSCKSQSTQPKEMSIIYEAQASSTWSQFIFIDAIDFASECNFHASSTIVGKTESSTCDESGQFARTTIVGAIADLECTGYGPECKCRLYGTAFAKPLACRRSRAIATALECIGKQELRRPEHVAFDQPGATDRSVAESSDNPHFVSLGEQIVTAEFDGLGQSCVQNIGVNANIDALDARRCVSAPPEYQYSALGEGNSCQYCTDDEDVHFECRTPPQVSCPQYLIDSPMALVASSQTIVAIRDHIMNYGVDIGAFPTPFVQSIVPECSIAIQTKRVCLMGGQNVEPECSSDEAPCRDTNRPSIVELTMRRAQPGQSDRGDVKSHDCGLEHQHPRFCETLEWAMRRYGVFSFVRA